MRSTFVVIAGAVIIGAVALSGQAQRQAATLDDVLNEIRALRADLRQTTRASTEVQLLTVRLQLQEQRLGVLSNQRNDINARLAIETRLRAEAENRLQRFEEMKTRNQEVGISRAELDANENGEKQQMAIHRDAELQLRAQESQLSTEIANEQNRWQAFNSRLDELERSLR
jgi:ribosome-associated translation inhibitor RaiA